LPGLRGDIARGGMQAVFAKLREGGGNNWFWPVHLYWSSSSYSSEN
jgi:hypothetical protein